MKFGEAIKYCFGHLFDFSGRARRSEFWYFYLFWFLISLVLSFVLVIVMFGAMTPLLSSGSGQVSDSDVTAFVGGIAAVYGVAFLVGVGVFVMLMGALVRRLHDMGQSGHWLWLYLVGLGIVPLIMAAMEGQPHANQWGPDPKAAERGFPPVGPQPTFGAPLPPVNQADPFATPPPPAQ